jgi:hypothetical protein
MNFYDKLKSVLFEDSPFIGYSVLNEIYNAQHNGCDIAIYGTRKIW